MYKAKLFKNGGSQAVRLPKEYRIKEKEVIIKKDGDLILIYPRSKAWEILRAGIRKFPKDYMADRNQPREVEQRDPL